MKELAPKDIIVEVVPHKRSFCYKESSAIRVHYTPANLTITCDKFRSQHKNKNRALLILRDLCTEFAEGDIVFTEKGEGLLINIFRGSGIVEIEGELGTHKMTVYLDRIGHTKAGYMYKKRQLLQEMLDDCKKDIVKLENEIKEIDND